MATQGQERYGIVTKFIHKGKFGFIRSLDSDETFFFHYTVIQSSCERPYLVPGEKVLFVSSGDTKDNKKLPDASMVRGNGELICESIQNLREHLDDFLKDNEEVVVINKEEENS